MLSIPMPPKQKKARIETERDLQKKKDQTERRRLQTESEKELTVERLLLKTSSSQKREQKLRNVAKVEIANQSHIAPTSLLYRSNATGSTLSFPAFSPLPLEFFYQIPEPPVIPNVPKCANVSCEGNKAFCVRTKSQLELPCCGQMRCFQSLLQSH